ncbi:MAG: hypothetical protein Kow0026_26190 [Oricola sp.]
MNWQLAIARNRDALLRIVAALFAIAGLDDREAAATLPRFVHNHVLRVLRPAESAVRRLVMIAARGLSVTVEAGPTGNAPASRGGASPAAAARPFPITDPLPDLSFRPFRRRPRGFPRISIIGVTEPCPIPAGWIPAPDDPLDASGIRRRLRVLKDTLDDLDRHAKRFARWKARRDLRFQRKDRRRGRYSPLRPGRPPGHRKRPVHEVDDVLRECHSLALHALRSPDTS